ncbi:hypothetical protein L5G28_02360 [Gordonia sp. HY285]|uniref:hypothetical protein n=1 Tax=Gordonia liuliyuniae TaxID=2911517 RepID=UPI001F1B71EC|nr:hypothetical protein [Gordonia liuliyuniae]MCF8609010.1 hypothetical protein [Gordonia liuliyuniae]
MNVPDGGYTKVNPDGSATIYDKDGNAVRQIAKPWAFDAAGRPQKTWYTVDENGDLIQHIEPADNALFPILADPWVSNGEGERVWVDQDTLDLMPGITPNLDTADTPDAAPAEIPPGGGVTAQDIPDVLADPPSPGNPTITSSGNTWGHEQNWDTNPDGSVSGNNIYSVTPKYGDPVVTEAPLTESERAQIQTLLPGAAVTQGDDGTTTVTPLAGDDGLTPEDVVMLPHSIPSPGEESRLPSGATITNDASIGDDGKVYDHVVVTATNGQAIESTAMNKSLSVRDITRQTDANGNPITRVTMEDGTSTRTSVEEVEFPGFTRDVQHQKLYDENGKLVLDRISWKDHPDQPEQVYYRDGDGNILPLTEDQADTVDATVDYQHSWTEGKDAGSNALTAIGGAGQGIESGINSGNKFLEGNPRRAWTPGQDFTPDQQSKLGTAGKFMGRLGTAGAAVTIVTDLAQGEPIGETVGQAAGGWAGGWAMAEIGAAGGFAMGGPPGAMAGAAILGTAGALGGSWVGEKIGGLF